MNVVVPKIQVQAAVVQVVSTDQEMMKYNWFRVQDALLFSHSETRSDILACFLQSMHDRTSHTCAATRQHNSADAYSQCHGCQLDDASNHMLRASLHGLERGVKEYGITFRVVHRQLLQLHALTLSKVVDDNTVT